MNKLISTLNFKRDKNLHDVHSPTKENLKNKPLSPEAFKVLESLEKIRRSNNKSG